MHVNYQAAVESHLRMWNSRASIICQYINDGIDSGIISEATSTLHGEWGHQNNGNEYIVLYQNELPSDVFLHGSEKGNRDAYWCACGYTLPTQRTPIQSQSIKPVSYTNMKNDQRRNHLSLVVCSISNLLDLWEFHLSYSISTDIPF